MDRLSERWRAVIAIVAIGLVLWFIDWQVNLSNERKDDELYKSLEKTCGVIKNQQPNNIDLYDDCMSNGMSELGQ